MRRLGFFIVGYFLSAHGCFVGEVAHAGPGKKPVKASDGAKIARSKKSSKRRSKAKTAKGSRALERRIVFVPASLAKARIKKSVGRYGEVRQAKPWTFYKFNKTFGVAAEAAEMKNADYASTEVVFSGEKYSSNFALMLSPLGGIVANYDEDWRHVFDFYFTMRTERWAKSRLERPLRPELALYESVLSKEMKKHIARGTRRLLVISTHGTADGDLDGLGQGQDVVESLRGLVSEFDRLIPGRFKNTKTILVIDSCFAGSSCKTMAGDFSQGILVPRARGDYAKTDLLQARKQGGEFFVHVLPAKK